MNVIPSSELREFARENEKEILNFLTDLIKIPSTLGNEEKAQRYVAREIRDLGYEVEFIPIPEEIRRDEEYTDHDRDISYQDRHNLIITHGGGDGRDVILNTHVDVVPSGSWSSAFTPEFQGGTVIGRGAVDCKGQIASMYTLLLMLREFEIELSGKLSCQIVIEEEIGGNGTLSLIRSGQKADGVIVLEGTDLTVCPANRGAVWFKATVKGHSTHMARKFEGISAIDKAVDLIEILYGYESKLAEESKDQPLFSEYQHPVQVNIGKMEAGDWPATVPETCIMEGGIGFLPNKNLGEIRKEVLELPKNDQWLEENAKIEFNRLHNDAYKTEPDHPLVRQMVRSARNAKIDTRVRGMIASCDARLFNKVGNMPTIVFGAGDIDQAHSQGERVEVLDIMKCSCSLFDFVCNWCKAR